MPTGIGVIVTLSSSTMIVIGRTDDTDSLIFCFKILFILDPLLRDKIQFGPLYHIRRGEFPVNKDFLTKQNTDSFESVFGVRDELSSQAVTSQVLSP